MRFMDSPPIKGSRSKDLLSKVKRVLRTACYVASHVHLEKAFMSIQKCAFIGRFPVCFLIICCFTWQFFFFLVLYLRFLEMKLLTWVAT